MCAYHIPTPASDTDPQLLDTCTWLALQAEGAPEVPSVSANMSCEYVRPAGQLGDTLWIMATIVQRGELQPAPSSPMALADSLFQAANSHSHE